MLYKSSIGVGLFLAVLSTSAFTVQNSPAMNVPTGWAALTIVLVVTIIVAILIIIQSRLTPSAITRYHLDHTEPGHSDITPREVLVVASTGAGADEVNKANPQAVSRLTEPDDLTKIEGIGPKISQLLNEAGISTYTQLAEADIAALIKILNNAGPRYGLADPSSWPEQAGYLAAGEQEKFKALTESLRSGRKS